MNELNRVQWYQLKDVLLNAKYNRENAFQAYEQLSDDLKKNEIAILILDFIENANSNSLCSAAEMLAPNTKNYWVALERL